MEDDQEDEFCEELIRPFVAVEEGEELEEHEENEGLWEERPTHFDAFWTRSSRHTDEDEYLEQPKPKQRYSLLFDIQFDSTATIRFLKAYIASVVAFILCLVEPINIWLGKYPFLLVFACLFHHPGRTSGSQLLITLLSVLGGALGIAWGSFGTFIATSTQDARHGAGAFHAVSLMFGLFISGWLKAGFLRLHFFCTTFFVCLFFMEVVDVSNQPISTDYWHKILDIVAPYLIGMAVSLLINLAVLPDYGQRDLVENYQQALTALSTSLKKLAVCQDMSENIKIKQKINGVMIRLSDESRERLNEISFTNMTRTEMLTFRNHISTCLTRARTISVPGALYQQQGANDTNGDLPLLPFLQKSFGRESASVVLSSTDVIDKVKDIVDHHFCPTSSVKRNSGLQTSRENLRAALEELRGNLSQFESQFKCVSPDRLNDLKEDPTTSSCLLHMYYLYGCAQDIVAFADFVLSYRHKWQVVLPSYPIYLALKRTTRQIRHDTGGESVLLFHWATREVDEAIADITAVPDRDYDADKHMGLKETPYDKFKRHKLTMRHRIWKILHRLQGVETKFAFRLTLTVTLLSMPAWLDPSRGWYNDYVAWLAPFMTFLMSHPFTAGTSTHLLTRSAFCILGGVWAGVSYRAHYGSPYVLAVMGAVFLTFTLYRYTSSKHPRSGFCGSVSFLLIAVILYTDLRVRREDKNIFTMSWATTVAAEIGVITSFVSSWILWPFIARSELYVCLGDMIDNLSKYAKYMFETHACRIGTNDIPESTKEMCHIFESRLLRKLHSIRAIVVMAQAEPLFRRWFYAGSYLSIVERCDRFLLDLIVCRISSTHFCVNPESQVQRLFIKDAIGCQLFLLYLVSGSLKQRTYVPQRVPSVHTSEQFLFEHVDVFRQSPNTWEAIHRMAFRDSFLQSGKDLDKLVQESHDLLSGNWYKN